MAELTLLGRCIACGQPRVQAAVCECGHPFWTHAIDPHRWIRTVCYRMDADTPPCGCRAYREVGRA